jgi:hypothetical protein
METFVELLMLKKEDHRNPLGFANGYLLIYSLEFQRFTVHRDTT